MSEFNINEDAQSGGEYSGSQSSSNEAAGASQQDSAFPDEDEETITMLDVIEREDKLEEQASAVLGNSDEKNCTYPKGYIPRQALYSCATCAEASGQEAAICLACSLECHDNHDVYELYTKRNFRCDCGNSRFKNFECKLMDKQLKKLPVNDKNNYNHNFKGKYCTCDKRYPPDENDDSAEANDEMWQCIVCEDWYHTKHLGSKDLPSRFDEMICTQCVDNLDFLHFYKLIDKEEDPTTTSPTSDAPEEEKVSESKSIDAASDADCKTAVDQKAISDTCKSKDGQVNQTESGNIAESDTNDSQAENKDPGNHVAQADSNCVLDSIKRRLDADYCKKHKKNPIFWDDCSWRAKLCRCQKCMDMYSAKSCEYLLDDCDTVQYYEAQGRAMSKNSESPYERGMSALNRMNRAAVVEALHGYDELKADLSDYLRKFADTKKVVREEDIHDFFQQLKSKKRPRLEFE